MKNNDILTNEKDFNVYIAQTLDFITTSENEADDLYEEARENFTLTKDAKFQDNMIKALRTKQSANAQRLKLLQNVMQFKLATKKLDLEKNPSKKENLAKYANNGALVQ